MSKDDKFLQFPISALRLDQRPTDVAQATAHGRLVEILGYCIVDVGKNYIARHDDDEAEEMIEESPWKPSGKMTAHQRVVLCGMSILNVMFTDPSSRVQPKSYSDDHSVINRLSNGSKILRLRTDLYWNYRDSKNDWTWREFSILCAVYAGIGAKPSARLSYEYISALAAGYSRIHEMPHKLKMPMHIVRHTVRKLESRGLFKSLCANGRHTHYSHSLNLAELAESLIQREQAKLQSEKSKALESLRQRMADLKPKPSKKPLKPKTDAKRQASHSQGNGKPGEYNTELARQEVLRALESQNDN
jgi:hypothetical protein